jgi:hypothetical protein
MEPYEFGPQDVGTDRPHTDDPVMIDHAATAAAERNSLATENHARAARIASTLARLEYETLLDLLAAFVDRNHRAAAEIIVDIIDGIA